MIARRFVYRERHGEREKWCPHCEQWLPLAAYYAERKRTKSWCKECFMWGVINRRRIASDPLVALQNAWSGTWQP